MSPQDACGWSLPLGRVAAFCAISCWTCNLSHSKRYGRVGLWDGMGPGLEQRRTKTNSFPIVFYFFPVRYLVQLFQETRKDKTRKREREGRAGRCRNWTALPKGIKGAIINRNSTLFFSICHLHPSEGSFSVFYCFCLERACWPRKRQLPWNKHGGVFALQVRWVTKI